MKDKIISIGFMLIISAVLFINTMMPDQDFSFSERRKLKALPDLNVEVLVDGSFFKNFGVYTIDQFLYRDKLRTLKHYFASEVMGQKDINGIYYGENHIFKKTETDDKAVLNALAYMNQIKLDYFKNNDAYFALIPDKSYYYDDHLFQPNYLEIINLFKNSLDDVDYINILEALDLNSYYKTDPHWRQDRLTPVMLAISKAMKFDLYDSFKLNTLEKFKGAYFSQGPLYKDQENLIYLTHEDFKGLIIINYEKPNEPGRLYDPKNIDGVDPYDVFLGGASPLIEITNPQATSDEEIIIFRDSFGSNIGPLFLKHYKKVTLVDTRYMPVDLLEEFVKIKDQKLLFLYSSLIINKSFSLK